MPESDVNPSLLHAEGGSPDRPFRDEYLLTTFDNPFDPFDQFEEWWVWDMSHGYNTLGFLARLSRSSSELSEADQFLAVQDAIDEIVRENVSGMHKKVKRGDVVAAAAA